MQGFNNSKRQAELKTFNERWFEDTLKAFKVSRDLGKAFFTELFPHREDLEAFIKDLNSYVARVPTEEHTLL